MRKIPAPYTDPTPLFRHGGALRTTVGPLLDFSANINPLGPPASVLRVLRNELPSIARYPDPDCRELTERLATLHGVESEQIVVGNGSNELIYAIARAFQPKRVAIAEPTYTEYLRASLSVGAKVDHWLAEGNDFKFTTFDPEKADLVWLCNPNNPTGGMWTSSAGGARYLARWIKAHPHTLFVVDEAFMDLRPNMMLPRALPQPIDTYLPELLNLIVLKSFTKVYAFPGLRLGYALMQRPLADRLRGQLVPWSVSSLAQSAGIAALDDQDYGYRTGVWLLDAADCLATDLNGLRRYLRPLPSQTCFILLRLKRGTAPWLTARLAARGIAIRDASNFVGLDDRYVRIAIRTPAENARLCAALESVFAEETQSCPARS